jgi:hypothetical protein
MPEFLSVGDTVREVARLRGVTISPRILTELAYRRALPCDTLLVGGRRLIPSSAMPEVIDALERRGYFAAGPTAEKAVPHA